MLAQRAPAYTREYAQTLFVNTPKRCRVPWRLPGTVWLWSTSPDNVQVGTPRLDLEANQQTRIPILFPPRDRVGFRTVDVVVSCAPPEFSNAKQYVLRFHLSYVDPTQRGPGEEPSRLDEGARDDLMATKRRLDEAERASTTEKLLQLSQQCAQLHVKRLATPRYEAPPSTFSRRDQDEIQSLKAEIAALNGALKSHILSQSNTGPSKVPRFAPHTMMNSSLASTGAFTANTRKRRQSKACEMRDGWFATYDYENARPYYFHPERRKVQWHPPPNQDAILVSYGKSPATSRPLESPAESGAS